MNPSTLKIIIIALEIRPENDWKNIKENLWKVVFKDLSKTRDAEWSKSNEQGNTCRFKA